MGEAPLLTKAVVADGIAVAVAIGACNLVMLDVILLGRLDGLRMISIRLFSFVWFEMLFDFNVPWRIINYMLNSKQTKIVQLLIIITFRWKWYLGQIVLWHCVVIVCLIRMVWNVVSTLGPDRPTLFIVYCRCDRRAIRGRKFHLVNLIFSIIIFRIFQIWIIAFIWIIIIIIIIILCHEMIRRSRRCRVHRHWKIRRWTLNGRLQGRSIRRQKQPIAVQSWTRRIRVVDVQMLLQAHGGRGCDIACNWRSFGTVQPVAVLGLFFASLTKQCIAAIRHSAIRMSRRLLLNIIWSADFQFSRQYCRCCVGRLVLLLRLNRGCARLNNRPPCCVCAWNSLIHFKSNIISTKINKKKVCKILTGIWWNSASCWTGWRVCGVGFF